MERLLSAIAVASVLLVGGAVADDDVQQQSDRSSIHVERTCEIETNFSLADMNAHFPGPMCRLRPIPPCTAALAHEERATRPASQTQ